MTSGSPLAGYAATQDYLFGLKTAGVKFGVDRMRILSRLLGNPERAVPCIHVAGTNGKGSVSAMLEAILRASGHGRASTPPRIWCGWASGSRSTAAT